MLFHSDPGLVERTVAALAQQTPRLSRLRIHINEAAAGELERTQRLLGALPDLVTSVTASIGNDGFAKAHNDALAELFASGADHVLVINPDLVLAPDAVAVLAASDAEAARLSGPLLTLAHPATMEPEGLIDSAGIGWTRSSRHLDLLQGVPEAQAPRHARQVEGITGACLLVGRRAYERLVTTTGEFFDEDFIAYREDAELGLRANRLGIQCWLIPAARGLHVRQLRGTGRGRDPHIDCLGVRNRFLIAFKHGRSRPGLLPLALARDVVVVFGVLLRERSSLPGLWDAWRLRHAMRAKGARIRAAGSPRQ